MLICVVKKLLCKKTLASQNLKYEWNIAVFVLMRQFGFYNCNKKGKQELFYVYNNVVFFEVVIVYFELYWLS